MAYTTINKSTEHFDTKVYTGNGTSQTLDMDNLGLLWMKNRTETSNHNLFDVVRGGYYISDPGPNLRTNNTKWCWSIKHRWLYYIYCKCKYYIRI
jgi:hypothetical protein